MRLIYNTLSVLTLGLLYHHFRSKYNIFCVLTPFSDTFGRMSSSIDFENISIKQLCFLTLWQSFRPMRFVWHWFVASYIYFSSSVSFGPFKRFLLLFLSRLPPPRLIVCKLVWYFSSLYFSLTLSLNPV